MISLISKSHCLVRALFIILITSHSLSAAPDTLDLSRELKALKVTYKACLIRAERIHENRQNLEDYFQLLSDIKGLEEKIEALEARLSGRAKGLDMTLPAFEIKGFYNQPGGKPMGSYASNGEIAAYSAQIEHPVFDGNPVATEVFFQLYGLDGKPVPKVFKRHKAYETGTTKTYRFRFKLDHLPQGEYKVGATHYLLENPDVRTQAWVPLKVFDAAVIDHLFATDTPGSKNRQGLITNDKQPHIYVYYSLAQGVKSADVAISVFDADTGTPIVSLSRTRPKEKQYLGIRLEKDVFKKDQRFRVQASVTTPDGRTKTAETLFDVGYYRLKLRMPGFIASGSTAGYAIQIPDVFEQPVKVDLNPSKALVLHHRPNSLTGKATGVGKEYDTRAQIRIRVTDAKDRIAQTTFSLTVGAQPKPVVTSPISSENQKSTSYRDDPRFNQILNRCIKSCKNRVNYLRNLPPLPNQAKSKTTREQDLRTCENPMRYLKYDESKGGWHCSEMRDFIQNYK
ncbi:MAG: hypothetical protein MI799_09320 [Desulfobacterales bacterium]|nr:hypothetical protein [Desulfobacterales bacterium]